MSKSKMKKALLASVAVVAIIAGAKAVSHARGPHHEGHHGADRDPSGFHGPMGMMQRWRGMTKEQFETQTRERFARLDKNSDGVIDAAEIEATLSEGRGHGRGWFGRSGDGRATPDQKADGAQPTPPKMGRFDDDRDGKVTKDEALDAMKRAFAAADLDGDGRITDADLPPPMRGRNVIAQSASEPALTGGGRRHGRGGPGGGVLRPLMGADQNKDNVITLDEALAHATKLFEARDRNKDNTIDAADRAVAQKEMLDYRVKRFLHMFGAKDGKVTREQFFQRANQRFAEMDRDNDGRLTRSDRHRGHGARHDEHGDDHRGRGRGEHRGDHR